jgi:hypothetical protein
MKQKQRCWESSRRLVFLLGVLTVGNVLPPRHNINGAATPMTYLTQRSAHLLAIPDKMATSDCGSKRVNPGDSFFRKEEPLHAKDYLVNVNDSFASFCLV